MNKVTNIGGVFFKAKDVAKLNEWYKTQLGFKITEWGASMVWGDVDRSNSAPCQTAWSIFKDDTKYLDPGTAPFMINYRVHDLKELIDVLRSEGVTIAGGIDEYDYGKFAWILDPEGRKIELWQPIDSGFGEAPPVWDEKVTGLAAVYLRSDDPLNIKDWYKKHLGVSEGFKQVDLLSNKEVLVRWDVLDKSDKIFSDTDKPFVYSYRVKENISPTPITDPEGNKIILTQP